MTTLTISNSGTALMREMMAQGKSPTTGVLNTAGTADAAPSGVGAQTPSGPALPTSLTDLLKLQAKATDDQDNAKADQLQQQIKSVAAKNSLPTAGNIINIQA